jgi:hypothetical protein
LKVALGELCDLMWRRCKCDGHGMLPVQALVK